MKLKEGKFQFENFLMFEDLTSNLFNSIAICHKRKPSQKNLHPFEKLSSIFCLFENLLMFEDLT
jgi:hypothetical protein